MSAFVTSDRYSHGTPCHSPSPVSRPLTTEVLASESAPRRDSTAESTAIASASSRLRATAAGAPLTSALCSWTIESRSAVFCRWAAYNISVRKSILVTESIETHICSSDSFLCPFLLFCSDSRLLQSKFLGKFRFVCLSISVNKVSHMYM